jgi:SAM-dependent methyltransferase
VLRKLAPAVLYKGIRVREKLACALEEMPEGGTFDLVVMINVLEHCFDAEAIFKRILGLTKPGSVFVFHDKLFDPVEVARDATTRFDAGHPLRIARGVIKGFLEGSFDPLLNRETVHRDRVGDVEIDEPGIYFIGTRR